MIRILAFILCFSFFTNNLVAQESSSVSKKKQLENKRVELLNEIDFTRKQLNDVRKQTHVNLTKLNLLKEQVRNRERMILNINEELNVLSFEISSNEKVITALSNELGKYKAEYAQMIQEAYKNQNHTNPLLFVVTSTSFNQAWNRLKYLQDYKQYREKQGLLISKTQESLAIKVNQLQTRKNEKEVLKGEEQSQKNLLVVETDKKNKTIIELKRDEKKLLADLRAKNAASERLNKAIEDVIRKEIAEARALALKNRKKENTSTKPAPESPNNPIRKIESDLELTPESRLLSSNFETNKGKLPWPVSRGFIVQGFGEHNHAVLKNVKVKNNGVDIKTSESETIKTIFKGEITGIVTIPGMQKVVIIRHGNYLTVYAHLNEVFVKMGQNVDAKQAIGSIYTDTENNQTEVHLEVWKGTQKLDPQGWLMQR